jgi:hypothetical protein
MTDDHIQWLLYGFCAGVFVCGLLIDVISLWNLHEAQH